MSLVIWGRRCSHFNPHESPRSEQRHPTTWWFFLGRRIGEDEEEESALSCAWSHFPPPLLLPALNKRKLPTRAHTHTHTHARQAEKHRAPREQEGLEQTDIFLGSVLFSLSPSPSPPPPLSPSLAFFSLPFARMWMFLDGPSGFFYEIHARCLAARREVWLFA